MHAISRKYNSDLVTGSEIFSQPVSLKNKKPKDKIIYFLAVTLMVSICFISSPKKAMAYGFGVAGSAGFGHEEENDTSRASIGLVYDSSLFDKRLFNYRGTISLQTRSSKGPYIKSDQNDVSFENDFGFALIRDATRRIWAGAEVRAESNHFGIGPVLGANYALGNNKTLCLKGGYMTNSSIWKEERYVFISIGVIFGMGRDKK